jgi:undecaprenyl-diphosphatase
MTILQALLLGVIEGLTEFLPVSSTAHLLIAQELLGISADGTAFSFTVLVQLGAIFALIAYFWKDLWNLLLAFFKGIASRKPFEEPNSKLAWMVGLASLPTLLVGYLIHNLVEAIFSDPLAGAGLRLLVTAAILAAAEIFSRQERSQSAMTWMDAFWVGLVQILTVFPGSSRSGAAITGGMLRGFDRPTATRFAFLMSVPIMLVAGAYQAFDVIAHESLGFLPLIAVGFIAAAVSGWYSIRWLIHYVSRRSFYPFVIYCFVLGVLAFVLNYFM